MQCMYVCMYVYTWYTCWRFIRVRIHHIHVCMYLYTYTRIMKSAATTSKTTTTTTTRRMMMMRRRRRTTTTTLDNIAAAAASAASIWKSKTCDLVTLFAAEVIFFCLFNVVLMSLGAIFSASKPSYVLCSSITMNWIAINRHDSSWFIMIHHASLWILITMDRHGSPWITKDHYGSPRCSVFPVMVPKPESRAESLLSSASNQTT